jgi:dTDP-glucose 4,6-dehydratase
MVICVTGAEGFIGSHLVERLLASGKRVKALVQYNSFNSAGWLEESKKVDGLEIVFGDVRDSEQMNTFVEGAESVLHLAALIAIPHSYQAPNSYVQTNVVGTLNLLNASKRAGVRRFVHTSTSEVYGTALHVPISEDHPLQGQSPYSASKIGADALAHSYWSSFNLPVVTLRPFNTFGPRQSLRAVIPTLLAQVIEGAESISLGSTLPTRDFTYIDDTVSGFVAAMNSEGIDGQTINLGTGFEISIGDLVRLVEEVVGKRIEVHVDSERLRPAGSEVERLLSDNRKAQALLSWTPKLSGVEGLKKGLRLTMDWLRPLVEDGRFKAGMYVK